VSDVAYMDAVRRGDLSTAQRLVDAAAKAAGVNQEIDPSKIKTFWRVGKPPEGGQSYNTKDQFFEKGVSTYFYPEATSFAGMDRSDWYKVSGEFIGYGSDGEPLVKVESFKKGTQREIDAALKKKPILRLGPGDSFRFPKYSTYADRFTVRSVKRRKDGSLYGYEISSSGIAKDYPIGTEIPNYRKSGPEYLADDELGVTDITYAPITYDDNGNVIPLSQRFDSRSDDIHNPRSRTTPKQFPYRYASYLKEHFPAVWAAGGNIRGNDAFRWWTAYRRGDRSPTVMYWWNTTRPAWIARHYGDYRLPGVIAQIKWGTVGNLGVVGMKRVVEDAIRRKL